MNVRSPSAKICAICGHFSSQKLTKFSSSFEALFKALRNNNAEEFSKSFNELVQLTLADPLNAKKVENFVKTLR